MGKHAYCIIAHTDSYCLGKLISQIDDPRNDIFIVPDRKSELAKIETWKSKYSTIYTPPYSQLVDIQWGGVSMVRAELLGFSEIVKVGGYDYVHLLSGQDLLIKSQDYIHDLFDSFPEGTNCVDISCDRSNARDLHDKTAYRYIFLESIKAGHPVWISIKNKIRNACLLAQRKFGFERDWSDVTLAKGYQWGSFSFGFISSLVQRKEWIFRRFSGVCCADEIYKQSVLLSSEFKHTLYRPSQSVNASLRRIDWSRGNPHVWKAEDYEELMNCREILARKFSSNTDIEIINRIHTTTLNNNL